MPRPSLPEIAGALNQIAQRVMATGSIAEDVRALAVLERAVRKPDLVSNQAAAEILGQERGNAARSLRRAGIEPLYEFPSGKVYDADAVRELAARKTAEAS